MLFKMNFLYFSNEIQIPQKEDHASCSWEPEGTDLGDMTETLAQKLEDALRERTFLERCEAKMRSS